MEFFMAIVMVKWAIANPAATEDTTAIIQRSVFPDKQICEIALKEYLEMAYATYRIPGVEVRGFCVPVGKNT